MTQVASQVDRVVPRELYVFVLLPIERHELIAYFRSVLPIIMDTELTNHWLSAHCFCHLLLKQFHLINWIVHSVGLGFHFRLLNSETSHAFVFFLPSEVIQTLPVQEYKFEQLFVVVRVNLETKVVQIRAKEVITVGEYLPPIVLFLLINSRETL